MREPRSVSMAPVIPSPAQRLPSAETCPARCGATSFIAVGDARKRPVGVSVEGRIDKLTNGGSLCRLNGFDGPPRSVVDLRRTDLAGANQQRKPDRILLCVVAEVHRALLAWAHGYAGNSATARTGEPVPPTHFKG